MKFDIDYEQARVYFSRSVVTEGSEETISNIKISRGEENIFRWCFFLAILQLAIDKDESYDWVRYVYIDDPITSLDENKAVAIACDLADLIRTDGNEIKVVVSTHHSLFYNIMYNELVRKVKNKTYFLHTNESNNYILTNTKDSPFFHHIAVLSDLKDLVNSERPIYTYHFNALRSILERTASFFGYEDFNKCIEGLQRKDELRFERALQLFSHGKYALYSPSEMSEDNKLLLKEALEAFLDKYEFNFPRVFQSTVEEVNQNEQE